MRIAEQNKTKNLVERSLEILLENQDANGAFVASPTFDTYKYCWFRDSSYIAYALDLYGERAAARRFFEWAAKVIVQREDLIVNAARKAREKGSLSEQEILHTRYKLDGTENFSIHWENFQLDGFGTWLWALRRHIELSGLGMTDELRRAVSLTADYLNALWDSPCYDCWEEFRDEIHPHTLAAIHGGLAAAQALTGADHSAVLGEIQLYLAERAAPDGYWQKFIGNPQVDASLIGLAVPYGVCGAKDPRMVETIRRIERDLSKQGVQRYATDTYYGGGRWILLSAWLGWYYCEIGDFSKAGEQLAWIEAQAGENGWLPEQVAVDVNNASMVPVWEAKWGKSADPLLWSHANYLILKKMME